MDLDLNERKDRAFVHLVHDLMNKTVCEILVL